jgi:hypothetical protein
MTWDKPRVLQKLRQLHRAGAPLSYTQLARRDQSLLSAAAYHFGSYRNAIERSGIDYAAVLQRPRWTMTRIVALIKQAHRAGRDLNWAAVISASDEVSRAAFAAIQPRLFGSWPRALQAAGIHTRDVARYQTWDRNRIVSELRSRAQHGQPTASGAVQKSDPGLHAAAVRYFGGYRKALRAAQVDGHMPRKGKRKASKRRRDQET